MEGPRVSNGSEIQFRVGAERQYSPWGGKPVSGCPRVTTGRWPRRVGAGAWGTGLDSAAVGIPITYLITRDLCDFTLL